MRIPPFSWRKISVFMLQSSFLDSHVLFVCSTPMLASKHLNLSQLNSHVQGKTQSFTSRFVCWCSSNLHMFSIKPKNGKFDIIRSYLTWTTWNQTVSKKNVGFCQEMRLLLGEEQLESFRLAHGNPHEKNHGKTPKSEWFQIVKPHFSHDSRHFYGCTEFSYHIIRKHIMILTVTNQNRH